MSAVGQNGVPNILSGGVEASSVILGNQSSPPKEQIPKQTFDVEKTQKPDSALPLLQKESPKVKEPPQEVHSAPENIIPKPSSSPKKEEAKSPLKEPPASVAVVNIPKEVSQEIKKEEPIKSESVVPQKESPVLKKEKTKVVDKPQFELPPVKRGKTKAQGSMQLDQLDKQFMKSEGKEILSKAPQQILLNPNEEQVFFILHTV